MEAADISAADEEVSRSTYIANVDNRTAFTSRRGIIRKRIRGGGCTSSVKATTGSSTKPSSAVASSPTVATTVSTAPAEPTTSAETSTSSVATGEPSTATTKAAGRTCKAIFTHFKRPALPIVAVELSNGVACVFRSLEGNDTRAFRTAIWANVDVGT